MYLKITQLAVLNASPLRRDTTQQLTTITRCGYRRTRSAGTCAVRFASTMAEARAGWTDPWTIEDPVVLLDLYA
jgi:hypothetical protein